MVAKCINKKITVGLVACGRLDSKLFFLISGFRGQKGDSGSMGAKGAKGHPMPDWLEKVYGEPGDPGLVL